MKSLTHRKPLPLVVKYLTLFCAMFVFATSGNAQHSSNERTYRITSVKSGAPSVTSVSNTVTVAPAIRIYIPNAFSPNGDGLNDEFGVVGEGIGKFSLKVYNNWGEEVFTSENLNDKWDGKFKGEPVPLSSYIYTVVAYGKNGGAEYLNGTITILR